MLQQGWPTSSNRCNALQLCCVDVLRPFDHLVAECCMQTANGLTWIIDFAAAHLFVF